MNQAGIAPVPGAVNPPAPDQARAALAERRRLRRERGSGFGRALTVSLALHSALAVVIGGIGAGVAYQRRSGEEVAGEESFETTIVFAAAPRPVATSSFVAPSAEPERNVENGAAASAAEPTMVAPDSMVELPMASAPEMAASSAENLSSASTAGARTSTNSSALDRAIGDPRSSWRLPSNAVAGLVVGMGSTPPVSECCGEPQPGPAKAGATEVYSYPEVVSMARAEFPVKSQRLGEQGTVLLEMTVGADGLVKDVRVVESSGYLRIDDCAVAAAWDWVFKPAMRNGVAEASLARHRYTFRLTSSGR
jgi:TonB family protein